MRTITDIPVSSCGQVLDRPDEHTLSGGTQRSSDDTATLVPARPGLVALDQDVLERLRLGGGLRNGGGDGEERVHCD